MGEILIWVTGIFIVGSLLVLERHCLGQKAIVQPLVLCLIAGSVSGLLEIGLWLGISIQLLSVMIVREADWALTGAVSAATILTSNALGFDFSVGSSAACALLLMSVVVGMMSRQIERFFARIDGERLREFSPWQESDLVAAIERRVGGAVTRWIWFGGLEVTIGVALCLLVIKAMVFLPPGPAWLSAVIAVLVPVLGVAVLVSALSERRFLVVSGVSGVVSWIILS